jgi:hypothetical protein
MITDSKGSDILHDYLSFVEPATEGETADEMESRIENERH